MKPVAVEDVGHLPTYAFGPRVHFVVGHARAFHRNHTILKKRSARTSQLRLAAEQRWV